MIISLTSIFDYYEIEFFCACTSAMQRITNDIIASIVGFFQQQEFGAFASTCQEYRALAYETPIQDAVMKTIPPRLPIVRHLVIDTPKLSHGLYQMLQQATYLEYLVIMTGQNENFGLPSMPNLEGFRFSGGSIRVRFPMPSLERFEAHSDIAIRKGMMPNLVTFMVFNPKSIQKRRAPDLTDTKLEYFSYDCNIQDASRIVPPSVKFIAAEVDIMSAEMPNLVELHTQQVPDDVVTTCPNLTRLSSRIHPVIVPQWAQITTLRELSIPDALDDIDLQYISQLTQLRTVRCDEAHIDIDDFRHYMPQCDLVVGGGLIVTGDH